MAAYNSEVFFENKYFDYCFNHLKVLLKDNLKGIKVQDEDTENKIWECLYDAFSKMFSRYSPDRVKIKKNNFLDKKLCIGYTHSDAQLAQFYDSKAHKLPLTLHKIDLQ